MTIEEQLKNEILNNYKSIRAFTQKIDIPYSTLDTIFKRGIGGAGVNTVLKIFNELSLDIESIDKGVLTPNNSNNNPVLNANEKKLISSYRSLNNQGKQKLLDYSNDCKAPSFVASGIPLQLDLYRITEIFHQHF